MVTVVPKTIGKKFDIGRVAPVVCVKSDSLKNIEIQGESFLLLIVRQGKATFRVGEQTFDAEGPCFICFDECENPIVVKRRGFKCDAIYFHPTFLNINMTFDRIRSTEYAQLASIHDLFLLKPFIDETQYVFPMFGDCITRMDTLFSKLEDELSEQYDWYWSCRGRSYFMEMILILERAYNITTQWNVEAMADKVRNPHLKNAIVFIESHFQESIKLEEISKAASISHSSLTQLFKDEIGITPVAYLWKYRIIVAKKHLAFTNLPIKDIALRCGFKTVHHFSRKFEEYVQQSPTEYRVNTLAARRAAF